MTTAPTLSRGLWATLLRRLRRDRPAMVALAVFALNVTACLLAPVYATGAGIDPFRSTPDAAILLNGVEHLCCPVVRDRSRVERPALTPGPDGRQVACHFPQ